MFHKKYFIILLGILLIGLACNKNTADVNGTVKDFTGFDGCGMMIVLDNGERLEIISLPQNTVLIANRRVAIKYKPVPRASICMAGTTAEITSLRYL